MLSGLDLTLPQKRKHEQVNWYLYTAATKSRDKIVKDLNANGIGAAVYYSTPVHKTPYYGKKLNLPVTDWAASSVVSLPVQPMVTEDNLRLTAKIIRGILT